MSARTIRHSHTSGRYDRAPRLVLRNLRRVVVDWRADVWTGTELSAEDRARMLKADRETYGSRRGRGAKNADDVAIMWSRSRFDLLFTGTQRLTTIGEDWRPAPPSALFVVLEERATGRRLLVTVAHMPTQVEGRKGWGHDHPAKVDQYRDAAARWARLAHGTAAVWTCNAQIIAADWNLDHRLPWVRVYLRRTFRLASSWTGRMPSRGTHGRRLIDGTLTDLRVKRVRVLAHDASSDHTPYAETLRW